MNEQSNFRIEKSLDISYSQPSTVQTRNYVLTTTVLFQKLKLVRKELKDVKKERDLLKRELLSNIRII